MLPHLSQFEDAAAYYIRGKPTADDVEAAAPNPASVAEPEEAPQPALAAAS